jgi:hypothetical protein
MVLPYRTNGGGRITEKYDAVLITRKKKQKKKKTRETHIQVEKMCEVQASVI